MKKQQLCVLLGIGLVFLGGIFLYGYKNKGSGMTVKSGDMTVSEPLVWYEVPELGARFKVTSDTQKDLGYSFKEYKMTDNAAMNVKSAAFFSLSETDGQFSGCTLSESGFSCGRIFVNVYEATDTQNNSELENNDIKSICADSNGVEIYRNQKQTICLYGATSLSDNEYRSYFHVENSFEKKYGLSLGSLDTDGLFVK
jgi:hypothetical protein